nr:Response regulator uvrY [Klebsiella pneumoniae]
MGDKVSVALSLILEIIPLINVLLVDDHELVRAGIRRILEDIKGLKSLAKPAAARTPSSGAGLIPQMSS